MTRSPLSSFLFSISSKRRIEDSRIEERGEEYLVRTKRSAMSCSGVRARVGGMEVSRKGRNIREGGEGRESE